MIIKIPPVRQYINSFRGSKLLKVFLWDIASKGSDFLLLPIYLKIFSQAEYGIYTFALYIITTASGIIKLGMDTSISKMYFETEKYERRKLLFSVNSIWIFLFFLILFISTLFNLDARLFRELMNMSTKDFNEVKLFIYIYVFFNLTQNTLAVYFVLDADPITYQKYNIIRIAFGNVIVLAVLYFIGSTNKAYLRLMIEGPLFLLAFLPLIIRFLKRIRYEFDWMAVKHSLKLGLPMVGTLMVATIYNITDKYFLQKTNGINTVAVYNLAIFLTLPVSLVFYSFQTVWLPKFFEEKSLQVKYKKNNFFIKKLIALYLGLFIVIYVGLFFCIHFNIISEVYRPIIFIYPILFVSKVTDNLIQMYINFIIYWGKTLFNLILAIIFASLTFYLNYRFIPMWGIKAAVSILLLIAILRILVFIFYVKYKVKKLVPVLL